MFFLDKETIQLLATSMYNHLLPRTAEIKEIERSNLTHYLAGDRSKLVLRSTFPPIKEDDDVELIEDSFYFRVMTDTVDWHAMHACNVHSGCKIISLHPDSCMDIPHSVHAIQPTFIGRRAGTYLLQLASFVASFPTREQFSTWTDALKHVEKMVARRCEEISDPLDDSVKLNRLKNTHNNYLNCKKLSVNNNWHGDEVPNIRFGVPGDITYHYNDNISLSELFAEYEAYLHNHATGKYDWSSFMTSKTFTRTNPNGSTFTHSLSDITLFSLTSVSLRLTAGYTMVRAFPNGYGSLSFKK